jgi:D-aminoacyl-tRNA deacylase
MLVLLGITQGDNQDTVKKYVQKLLKLRIWNEIPKKKPQTTTQTTTETMENKEEEKVEKPEEANSSKKLKTWDSNVIDNQYEILLVSQFTLYGVLKGNKPDFHNALNPDEAIKLYEDFIDLLKITYKEDKIQTGKFGQYMNVSLVNDGPVTLIIDSEKDKE